MHKECYGEIRYFLNYYVTLIRSVFLNSQIKSSTNIRTVTLINIIKLAIYILSTTLIPYTKSLNPLALLLQHHITLYANEKNKNIF